MDNPLQLSLVNFKKDAYIIVEGKQNADHFYILRSGKVRISKEAALVQEEESDVLNPGDFFGVVSTMSGHSHIETAQALSDVSLIQVHRDQYGLLIEKNAPVALKIIQGFSKRMRYLDNALTQFTLKNSAETEDPNHLFQVAEYYARQSKYNQAFYSYYQYIRHLPGGPNVAMAKERMMKIKPYAKVAYLEPPENEFNRNYPKDTMIFSEGQPGNELYIIQKGSVKISKIVDDKEVMLALLKPGDIFGEMALLDNKARSASADAYEDTALLAVNRANFQQMIQKQPQLITRLTTLLADRIWLIYKQLANTTMENLIGRLYDALMIQLEKNRVTIREGQNHSFPFGVQELLKMVGISPSEGNAPLKEVLKNSNVKIIDNKIQILDTADIEKQVKFYRKMDKLNQTRQGARR